MFKNLGVLKTRKGTSAGGKVRIVLMRMSTFLDSKNPSGKATAQEDHPGQVQLVVSKQSKLSDNARNRNLTGTLTREEAACNKSLVSTRKNWAQQQTCNKYSQTL